METNDSQENQKADPPVDPESAAEIDGQQDFLQSTTSSTPSESNAASPPKQASAQPKPLSAASKKSFKPQSLNGIFRQLQATSVAKPATDRTSNSSSPQSAQASLNASKLRMTPKLATSGAFTLAPLRRDMSLSPRPGSTGLSSSGSSSRLSSQHVWNKGQGAKPHKEFSEEELKKLGIHLTQSIAVNQKGDKWDEDDDDDWGDTIDFIDPKSVQQPDSTSSEEPKEPKEPKESNEPKETQEPAKDSEQPDAPAIPKPEPPVQSPWAPIPHIQPTLLSKIVDNPDLKDPDDRRALGYDPNHSLSQDARNRTPIVLSRDRFSDMEFDRSYGYKPPGHGPEIFNDRSGLIEPVRRRSFTSWRPQLPPNAPSQKVIMSRTGRDGDRVDHARPRRGSSSVSDGSRRRMSVSRAEEPDHENADQGSVHSSQSPTSAFSQLTQDDSEPTRRPAHITAQQELIMKQSIENARKRKEEEQRRDQERLESARKRAEEIVRKKQLEKQAEKTDTAVASSPEVEHALPVKKISVAARRKESAASSDGGESMDASVTAAIEFLISEPSASHPPPVSKGTVAKPDSNNVAAPGWDNARGGAIGRPGQWNRNGLNENSRYVRGLVNGNDNVWGPVGSVSRYPSIDGVGNGSVESRSFLNGPPHAGAHGSHTTDWAKPNPTPAQLSENWRRPLSTPPVSGPPASSSAAVHAPVGTPIASPTKAALSPKSTKQESPVASSTSTGAPAASSASSSRPLSRFFPSGAQHKSDRAAQSATIGTMLSGLGADELEDNIYMTEHDGRMDDYLLLSQSVQSLLDDNGNVKPKVHLPAPPTPTVKLPNERANGYPYELAESRFVLNDSNSTAEKNLGYVGARMPSIGAIEAVQSRIALTLGHEFKLDDLSQPPIKRPITILTYPKLSTISVEPFDVSQVVTPEPCIKLAEYPQHSNITIHRQKNNSAADAFHLAKKVPGNFVGALASAVSSASPASNPFNPQRRGGGSSAYKIMLPGLHEHILVPVNVPGGSATHHHHHHQSYSRRGDSWNRRGSARQAHQE